MTSEEKIGVHKFQRKYVFWLDNQNYTLRNTWSKEVPDCPDR